MTKVLWALNSVGFLMTFRAHVRPTLLVRTAIDATQLDLPNEEQTSSTASRRHNSNRFMRRRRLHFLHRTDNKNPRKRTHNNS